MLATTDQAIGSVTLSVLTKSLSTVAPLACNSHGTSAVRIVNFSWSSFAAARCAEVQPVAPT